MSKNNDPENTAAPAPFSADEITLEEFCTRLSNTDRRVELIGAFSCVETAAGRIKDAETAYAARLAAFVNKPV